MGISLVTGGAGFLGSHLCDRLISVGHQVICMDNLITERLSTINHLIDHIDFEFIKSSVGEHMSLEEVADNVLHFAGPASPKDYSLNTIHTLKVGAIWTLNALGLARSKDARFCLVSTSEAYGSPLESLKSEAYLENVNPVDPRSVYDEAK